MDSIIGPRYVAHLDILGMSELTLKDFGLAWACLCRFAQARNRVNNFSLELLPSHRHLLLADRVHIVTFSDTLLLFTRSDEEDDLLCALTFFTELFGQSTSFSVPIRGGLAHGLFQVNLDESLFCGPALVNAYSLGESVQWMGLVVDDVVAQRARGVPIRTGTGAPVVVYWEVPQKLGRRIRQPVVNWPSVFCKNFQVQLPISSEVFYQAFGQLFGAFDQLPPDLQTKYRNTTDFVNAQLQQELAIGQGRP